MRKGDIDLLIREEIIDKVIGKITEPFTPCFVAQARSAPKFQFNCFIELSRVLSNNPLQVYIDNLFSQNFLQRSGREQSFVDRQYVNFFRKRNCDIYFTKKIFKNQEEFIDSLIRKSSEVTYFNFLQNLPIAKEDELNLGLQEIFHTTMELCLFDYLRSKYINPVLLVGHTSQAIAILDRKTNPIKTNFIVTSLLKDEKMSLKFLEKLTSISNRG